MTDAEARRSAGAGEIKEINMSDLIDRQAAIEALDKRFDSIPMEQTSEILMLRKDLRELPPAQPERIIHCKDCEHGVLDDGFPHQYFCVFKGDEWNNADYFCGHAKRREVTE